MRWRLVGLYILCIGIPAVAQDRPDSKSELLPVVRGEQTGFADKKGDIKIEAQFEDARPFSNGLAAVKKDGAWAYINTSGKVIIEGYLDAFPFRDGRAVVGVKTDAGKRYRHIDREGLSITGELYSEALPFSEGTAAVRTGQAWKLLSTDGSVIKSVAFEEVGEFSHGLAPVKQKGLWGFINTKGNIELSPKFLSAKQFGSGLAPVVEENGAFSLIDVRGKAIRAGNWDQCGQFSNGLARIKQEGGWSYIDTEGNEKNWGPYVFATDFFDGVALTIDQFGRSYYIDDDGTQLMLSTDVRFTMSVGVQRVKGIILKSTPQKAAVYMVPKRKWLADPGIVDDETKLAQFRVPQNDTDTTTDAYRERYVVVFILNGKTRIRHLDVRQGQENKATANFEEE